MKSKKLAKLSTWLILFQSSSLFLNKFHFISWFYNVYKLHVNNFILDKGTTKGIHIIHIYIIQGSQFKKKQDLKIKHKRCISVLPGKTTIINKTLT